MAPSRLSTQAASYKVAVYDVVRVLLAVLLLVAAILKGLEIATQPIAEQGLVSTRWFLIGQVEFELFAGTWLLSGLFAKYTRRAAIGLFAVFAAVSLHKAITGAASCGCFGQTTISPRLTFVFDLVAVALLAWSRPLEPKHCESTPTSIPVRTATIRGILAVIWVLTGMLGGLAMAGFRPTLLSADEQLLGSDHVVLLEPETWIGRQLPLIQYVDVGEEFRRGEWTVLLYHYDCPKCQEVLPLYKQEAEAMDANAIHPRVALIEMPPYGDDPVPACAFCLYGRLRADREWFATTPVEIRIKDGIVVAAQSVSESEHLAK